MPSKHLNEYYTLRCNALHQWLSTFFVLVHLIKLVYIKFSAVEV